MRAFLFIFRVDYSKMKELSAEELKKVSESAKSWIASVADKGKLADKGNRLVPNSGKVLKSERLVTDGPYVETKESINGYLVVKAATLDEAAALAKDNPIFQFDIGGSVEVRGISAL